jgi:hypothetical protein
MRGLCWFCCVLERAHSLFREVCSHFYPFVVVKARVLFDAIGISMLSTHKQKGWNIQQNNRSAFPSARNTTEKLPPNEYMKMPPLNSLSSAVIPLAL